jgi:general secretion pathway protein C
VLEEQLSAALIEQAASEAAQRRKLITANNIFCPSCQPAGVAGGVAAGVAGAGETAPGEPVIAATELPLALLATMEADDPLSSMATILDTEHDATGVFGLDDQIRPGVFVAGIRAGVVTLRQGQGVAILDFTAEPPAPEPKQPPKQAPAKKGSREIEGASEAIDCQGDACTVDRKFVDKLLANPQLLMKQAKFLPAVKDGETRGFRVLRVMKGTLPQILGLRNGDTLLSVNGTELDSMDRAMGLYSKLRRASELSLTVERKGKVIQKQISIR